MGACESAPDERMDSWNADEMFDEHVEEEIKRKIHKLLLLGAGQSGKSTLTKQMLRIYNGDMLPRDRREYIGVISTNIVVSMARLLRQSHKWAGRGASLESQAKREDAGGGDASSGGAGSGGASTTGDSKVERKGGESKADSKATDSKRASQNGSDPKYAYASELKWAAAAVLEAESQGAMEGRIEEKLGDALKALWADAGIQCCYARRSEIQLYDSARYYFERIPEIAAPQYCPTMEHVLRARAQTTGVVSERLSIGSDEYELIDVGGQRSERRKWMRCFMGSGSITAVLFIVGVSSFNTVLVEDGETNRLVESHSLFREYTSKLKKTQFILFLNKYDLFLERIRTTDITDCPLLADFKGDCRSAKETLHFIESKFRAVMADDGRPWYCHYSNATDKNVVETISLCIADNVLQTALAETGIVY